MQTINDETRIIPTAPRSVGCRRRETTWWCQSRWYHKTHPRSQSKGHSSGHQIWTTDSQRKSKLAILALTHKLTSKQSAGGDSGQQNWIWTIRDGLCRNCTVLKGHVGLANVDGTPVSPNNDVYIHHILTFDTTKKQKSFLSGCASGAAGLGGAKFIGSGEDNNNVAVWYTARDGKSNNGFHIGSSDSFMMNIDLVSYHANTKQIYLTMDMEYLPGLQGADARYVFRPWMGCLGLTIS